MISTSLSPNTQADDIKLAAHTLLHPHSWQDESVVQHASLLLSQYLAGSFITLTSSGRSALEIVLKAIGLKPEDEIIMQAFTCIAVPEPVLWRRVTPVYADILPRQYTINPDSVKKKITPNTRAIIAQHTYGLPADMAALRQIADEHNLFLIEDCAHALGSTLRGQPLGTFSDAAIFSFGRDKSISSVYGGAIATKNRQLMDTFQADISSRSLPPQSWVIQQLLHPLIFNAFLPLYNHQVPVGQTLIKLSQSIGLLSKAVTTEERQGKRPRHIRYRYSPALAGLAVNQIQKLAEYTARRQAIATRYFSALAAFDFSLPRVPAQSNPAWLRFPIMVKNQSKFLQAAAKQNIYLGDWYDAALVPKGSNLINFQYTPGQCPQAEHAAAHVINLPTHPRLTDDEVDTIIEFTKAHAQPYYETL